MPSLLHAFKALIAPRSVKGTGDRLYAQCVAQARLPVFYLDYAIPDEIGARFELLTFHVGLVIHRLRSLDKGDARWEQAQETAQALFDSFLLALDSTLREQGVGDLSVPKKMKKLGQVVYTRMARWEVLLAGAADAQADYAARTLYADDSLEDRASLDDMTQGGAAVADVPAAAFAAYARAAHDALRVDEIMMGRLDWPVPAALKAAAE
jgi:cytochrome b pre-mRNA-processing protein 3